MQAWTVQPNDYHSTICQRRRCCPLPTCCHAGDSADPCESRVCAGGRHGRRSLQRPWGKFGAASACAMLGQQTALCTHGRVCRPEAAYAERRDASRFVVQELASRMGYV